MITRAEECSQTKGFYVSELELTETVSPLMKPDKLPRPYRMENCVPFWTYVLDFFEL